MPALFADKQNIGLVEKTIEKIINNAQVTIKNIHVRFEDTITVPGVSILTLARTDFFRLMDCISMYTTPGTGPDGMGPGYYFDFLCLCTST